MFVGKKTAILAVVSGKFFCEHELEAEIADTVSTVRFSAIQKLKQIIIDV